MRKVIFSTGLSLLMVMMITWGTTFTFARETSTTTPPCTGAVCANSATGVKVTTTGLAYYTTSASDVSGGTCHTIQPTVPLFIGTKTSPEFNSFLGWAPSHTSLTEVTCCPGYSSDSCTPASCNVTNEFSSGATVTFPNTASGSSSTVSCPSGYTGSLTYSCSLGNWGYASGACNPDPCNATNESSGGATVSIPYTTSGSSSTGACPAGYTGSLTYSCSLGNWSYSSGSCSPNPCSATNKSSGGATVSIPYTTSGSSSTGACPNGYIGSLTYSCSLGNWNYSSGSCLPIINGGWSNWSGWGPCTSNGGGGCNPANYPQTKTRSCNNPIPANTGAPCTVDAGATCTSVSGSGCLAESGSEACTSAIPAGGGGGTTYTLTGGTVTSTWSCGGYHASCNPSAAAAQNCYYNGCAPVVSGATDAWTEQSNSCSPAAHYYVAGDGTLQPDACTGSTPCGGTYPNCYAKDACNYCNATGPTSCSAPKYCSADACVSPSPCSGSTPCGSPGSCYAKSGCDNACDSTKTNDACNVCGGTTTTNNFLAWLGCDGSQRILQYTCGNQESGSPYCACLAGGGSAAHCSATTTY